MGRRVIEALGIETSATHMEWFYGPKGLQFSEIGCRPPGVGAWDLYSAANDVDVYREWAHVIVARRARAADVAARTPPASSRCAPTTTARSPATAASTRSSGRYGEWIIDAHFPPVGHAHPAGRGRLHGQRLGPDAPPRLRHRCARMLDDVGRTVHVHAG